MSKSPGTPGLDKINAKQAAIMLAVILASIMTGYYTRLVQTALPDLRGIWGLSVDEGAVLNTLVVAPQMLLAPIMPWLATVFGFRPIILPSAIAFIVLTLVTPFLTGYIPLLVAHALIGLLLGCFMTITVMIVFRNVPPSWWIILLGFYVFRLVLTINTGVSVSALYTEYLGWQWIYWQSAILMVFYLLIMYHSLPVGGLQLRMLVKADYSGMAMFCLGTTLIYVAFDQGEHLGWFDSGFIVACLGGGLLMMAQFCFHEKKAANPWASPTVMTGRNVMACFIIISIYGFLVTANAMLITQFLGTIQALKPLQTGKALVLIAISQVAIIPPAIYATKRIDPRLVCAFGFLMLALACHQGTLVTSDWAAWDFVPMGIFFALGLPFVFLAIMALTIANFDKDKNPSILAYIQIGRLVVPAMAGAIISVFLRWRKDTHNIFLGENLTYDNRYVTQFIDSADGGLEALTSLIQTESFVLAFQDTFALCFWVAAAGLALLVFTKPSPPTPICRV